MKVIKKKTAPAPVESVTVQFASPRFEGMVMFTVRKAEPFDPDSSFRQPGDITIVQHGDYRPTRTETFSEAGARGLMLALREYFGE
jgi:hypothetical protein